MSELPCPICGDPMYPAMERRYGACTSDHGDLRAARMDLAGLAAVVGRILRDIYPDSGGGIHLGWPEVRALLVAMESAGFPVWPGAEIPPLWKAAAITAPPAPQPCWHMDGPCPEDQCEAAGTIQIPGRPGWCCPQHLPFDAWSCCRLCRRPKVPRPNPQAKEEQSK